MAIKDDIQIIDEIIASISEHHADLVDVLDRLDERTQACDLVKDVADRGFMVWYDAVNDVCKVIAT